ncbi:hypothetical protein [uncultured Arthrobacter sp.]|uniref:hypothetical protein n=1 Tax=uncultured Arthrobacter sp. TaxID=114050 RepID=UPI002603235C|nr:hypothetical protein [uncultured Arthrobacter sp.]
MKLVEDSQITRSVEIFLQIGEDRKSALVGRTRSWDFCFNHFQSNPYPTNDMQLSCLQLGYYLASWGMLRGSSYLFTSTNARHYSDAIRVIEKHNPEVNGLDARNYADPHACQAILAAYDDLRSTLLPEGGSHTTLVSKVMMGVWGVIPSFDTYFIKGFRRLSDRRKEGAAFRTVSDKSLTLLGVFYSDHRAEIDSLTQAHTTLDFDSGNLGSRAITGAKVLDMFGFGTGYRS